MRKLSAVLSAVTLAGALFAAVPAFAEPSDKCAGGEVDGVVATGTDGASSISVCADGVGAVTAAQTGDMNGYVVADGDGGNMDPTDGFLGVSDKGVHCSDEGDFDYATATMCSP